MIFGGIPDEFARFETSQILLQPITFDGTSTWGKGADKGLEVFIDATENMELYDIETDSEVYQRGIHVLPVIDEDESAEAMFNASYERAKEIFATEKFVTFFGGEHSVSIGPIKAAYEKFENLTVLQFDAHADLRKDYMGTPYNHACALHDASKNTNLIQVGIRSMDVCELEYMNKSRVFFAADIYDNDIWEEKALAMMTDNVYVTIDLDVFDPAILPGTGTPEPGGLGYYQVLKFLRKVFETKNVIAFDIVELAPIPNHKASEFLVAKLYYKLLSYKFLNK